MRREYDRLCVETNLDVQDLPADCEAPWVVYGKFRPRPKELGAHLGRGAKAVGVVGSRTSSESPHTFGGWRQFRKELIAHSKSHFWFREKGA